MRGYGPDEDLDEYEDDFIDDQDGGDVSGYRYADEEEVDDEEEEEEEEVEEEPVSEEALKLLRYRQKLKEQMRSKLRQENGTSSREMRKPLPLNNFGSFFGPSKPVIADRVIQESKALLETRHLAPKASSSQNNGKKVSMPSSSGTKNGVARQVSASQVKSKAQIIKQTRDYSFLLSDNADVPKPKDPGQQRNFAQKLDARPPQVPAKSNGLSAQSGRKVVNGTEQRKPFGSSQVSSTRAAPARKLAPDNRASATAPDSRMQIDMRKQPQHTKHMGSGTGNGYVRPPISRPLPQKRPPSSIDKRMPSGSVEKNLSSVSASNRALSAQRHSAPNGQRMPTEKLRGSGVTKPLEHKRSVGQFSDNRVFKEDMAASKTQVKPPKQTIYRANLDRDHTRLQKPQGQLSVHKQSGGASKGSNIRKRRAEEDDGLDFRSQIRQMFGYNPSRFRDDDDDDLMEVGFDTIRQEEIRSARIAKKEDDEEWEKIQEEERQERLRKKARMQKMRQR